MKRLIISIFIASTFLLAFAGCGNSNEEETTTSEDTTTEDTTTEETSTEDTATEETTADTTEGEAVTIDFWYSYSEPGGSALEQAAVDFSEQSGIQVNSLFVAGDSMNDKVISSTSAGQPPDVVTFDRFMTAQWAENGLLTDLTPYLEEIGLDMTLFYPFATEESTYEGKYYSVPFDTDARALYWNKEMFATAGLDPEKGPTTIEELDAYAEACTVADEDGRIIQFGFIPWYGQGGLYTWGTVFGGDFYDEEAGMVTPTDDEILASLEWMYSYAEKYGAETIQSATDAGGQAGVDLFIAEKLAMTVGTQGLMTTLNEANPEMDYGVCYLPTPTGTDYTTWSGGWAYIVPTGSDNPLEACQFIEYLTLGEGAILVCETIGNYSAAPSLNEQLQWPTEYEYNEFFLDSFEISQCRPPISEGALYWDEMMKATNNTLFGEGTAEENLQNCADIVNAEIQASE